MSNIESGTYIADGVQVDFARPVAPRDERPPLIFVHGGCHGSWCWETFLPFFADAGWECHALSWYNHHGSKNLPVDEFVGRSIADVGQEIGVVAARLGRTPVLVGHSMGGLASQKYAEQAETEALVLLGPGVPVESGVPAVPAPMPVEDGVPWGPPPFEVAQEAFFQGSSDDDARRYYALLCAESPRAVHEVTDQYLNVDASLLVMPILVIAGDIDILCLPSEAEALAKLYGADYILLEGVGHNFMLEPGWRITAARIEAWLDDVSSGPH